jgi:hypothetical protein
MSEDWLKKNPSGFFDSAPSGDSGVHHNISTEEPFYRV